MARLIHLNGSPGVGKSTLARRYVDAHPGVLACDIDVLRTLVGGWERDFVGVGALIRPAALAMIGAYLENGHDVVLPQMIARLTELERFRSAAANVGADYRHVMLVANQGVVQDRFYRRPVEEPHHAQIRAVVDADGGPAFLAALHDRLLNLAREVDDTLVVEGHDGDEEQTYLALIAGLASRA